MKNRFVINGFGRIGRAHLRQILTNAADDDIDVAQINDISPLETCACLLKHNSTFGPLPHAVEVDDAALAIEGTRIPFTTAADIAACDLRGVDVVLECTGRITSGVIGSTDNACASRDLRGRSDSPILALPETIAPDRMCPATADQSTRVDSTLTVSILKRARAQVWK